MFLNRVAKIEGLQAGTKVSGSKLGTETKGFRIDRWD
jgi:hypothetical protein